MYIHIGADVSIPAHWIMGIFDLDRLALTGATADFLKEAEKDNKLDLMTPDLPRSLIVTMDRVFMSPVSTATLRARLMGRQGDSKG